VFAVFMAASSASTFFSCASKVNVSYADVF